MRKSFLTLAAGGFMLTSVSACSDHGHSHDDVPQHHDSIN